jgi:hypothetical protein
VLRREEGRYIGERRGDGEGVADSERGRDVENEDEEGSVRLVEGPTVEVDDDGGIETGSWVMLSGMGVPGGEDGRIGGNSTATLGVSPHTSRL